MLRMTSALTSEGAASYLSIGLRAHDSVPHALQGLAECEAALQLRAQGHWVDKVADDRLQLRCGTICPALRAHAPLPQAQHA